MQNQHETAFNPWKSMWTKPRQTIQKIIDTDYDNTSAAFIIAISGIASALDKASLRDAGDQLKLLTILSYAFVLGPIFGLAMWYFYAFLLRWTGKWIGGKGTYKTIRSALAWSNIPVVAILPVLLLSIALFGNEIFTAETPAIDNDLTKLGIFLFLILVELTLTCWSFIIFWKALGQIQGFSAWKALGNSLLATMVVIIPILIVAFVVVFFSSK